MRRLRLALTGTTFILVVVFYLLAGSITNVTRWYGFAALGYLYVTLIISPWVFLFPNFPFHKELAVARKPLGQGAFVFALLHGLAALFGSLGGIKGLFFLPNSYVASLGFGLIALIILTILEITSLTWFVAKLGGRRWKFIHRFVYLAGLLTVMHVLLIGSHYNNFASPISKISLVLLGYIIFMEGLRVIRFVFDKKTKPAATLDTPEPKL